MHISEKDIEKIARLSRLELRDQDVANAQKDLMGIFNWMSALQAIDVSTVDLSQINHGPLLERADIVVPNTTLESVLKNAPSTQHDMFCVPKVVE